MLSNYPATKRHEIAESLIETVIPMLAEAIDNAATDLAGNLFGDELTAFDVERLSNDILFALADFLVLAPTPQRGIHDMLRIHQLQPRYAADYLGVSLHDIDDGDDAILEDLRDALQAEFGDPPPKPTPPAAPKPAYVPAIHSPEPSPAAPTVVVDNRPKPRRTLEEIKAEVDARRHKITPINFTPYNEQQEQRRIAIERAKLEQERKDDERIEQGIKRESQLDARDERDLQPMGQLPMPELKADINIPALRMKMCANEKCRKKFQPKNSQHIYCSDTCRTVRWHRQFGRKRST